VDAPGSYFSCLLFLIIYIYFNVSLEAFVLWFPSFVEFLYADSFVLCFFCLFICLSKERYYVGRGMYESTTDFIK
jgi:hypothetical protein